MVFSYQISTLFPSSYGFSFPYADVRVVAFDETMQAYVTLYSKRYAGEAFSTGGSYDVTVKIKETYRGNASSLRIKRIMVTFEADFERSLGVGPIQNIVQIPRASLLLMTPSPPPTITTTLTVTITSTEAVTVTETIRQRAPVMPIELVSTLVLVAVLAVGTAVGVATYVYSKRRVKKR